MRKAKARYNMSFDAGNFIKEHFYDYDAEEPIGDEQCLVYVRTETGSPQQFTFSEFDMLFDNIKE